VGGQASLDQAAGIFDPANAGIVAEGCSRGGQACAAKAVGAHDPAMRSRGQSRGGQTRAVQQQELAAVAEIQAYLETNPAVGSRKRTAVQRMDL
jgi:hypothetical protein